jgi:signal transduction histidine kinase
MEAISMDDNTCAEVAPGRDPPLRADIVHESERTRVTRLIFAGCTVIRKEPLGPDAARRLRHEAAMLERLRGVVGVAQLVESPRYAGSTVVTDGGGTSLAGLAKPLAVDDLIELAIQLTRAVAGIHHRGVIHRNISAANIVLSDAGAPCLVDFALATSLAEIRPEFAHHTEIPGALAYLAPEQTGRTGRPVDQRADLYGLGATLYELATGAPPFGSGDPLRLTHDHLARIPVPPAQVNPAVPASLSAIILHLLEKEPDNRYQTADGVIYDLDRLRDGQIRREKAALRVGEHDFPLRLLPPSRLVGRDNEVAALRAAFEQAQAGRCRGVLVSGAAGVGKTALVDELRPVVTGADGWFIAGKFDQYRRDLEFHAAHQALRALGRMLLAEPEDELAKVRGRILGAVGPNVGLLTALAPEFAALLGVPPDPGNPLTAQVRAQRVGVGLLRAVASRERPLVLFIDDLQWAGRPPLGVVDLVLSEEQVDGLLLIGAYRDDDVDASHPLASMVPRWRQQAGIQQVHLENLPVSGSVTLIAEMLHVGEATATGLAAGVNQYTSGNPYETVELLNTLRRDGLLSATAGGWRWDDAAVRAHLSQTDVAGLLAARVDAMPPTSRAMVEAMACLGGRAELSVLQIATAAPALVVEQTLAPALDEGLLVVEPGAHEAVRFRHDRTREVMLAGLDPQRRRTLQLTMARRLAGKSELFAVAAEQYLPVIDGVDDAAERTQVVGLLRRAADQATLTGDHAHVNALLAAALRQIDPGQTATLVEVHTGRHAALYGMGRLDEGDEEYRTIDGLCSTATERSDATVVQMLSLTQRSRLTDAIALGLDSLRELGITVPPADRLPAELDRQFGHLYRWLDHTDAADDLARSDITDAKLLAVTRLLNAVLPAMYFVADHAPHAWLSLETLRIWLEHGPGSTLVGPASTAAFATVTLRGDYAAGYRAVRRIVALGEARGYEPDTAQARFMFSVLCSWFEPVENCVLAGQRAREGLIGGGDLANAGYTWQSIVAGLLDCAPSLDTFVAEVEAGLAFGRRTGSEHTGQVLDSYRWLVGVLRGESAATASEAAPIDTHAGNPLTLFFAHTTRALAAAVCGDPSALARHTAAAMPLLPTVSGHYVTAMARLLRGLALAGQARMTEGDERVGLLSELDDVTQWLAARAVDQPHNFLHMLRLLEAEQAWTVGDFRAGALAFDSARREAAGRERRWHRAMIAEQTARFFLAHGLEQTGHDLLIEARQEYLAWGATAKVSQLDWAYPTLRPDHSRRRTTVSTGTVDLLGIVSASQALSSQTSIEALHTRVVEVLSGMTGATGVHVVLWSDDRQDWLLPEPDSDGGTVAISHGREAAVPMSVLRYAQRMREPLVVADATRDDRFARDPYFTDADCCSVLAVPVLRRGILRAVLLLENRLMRGAFTAERLDGVNLIAGQLAVSLDNAQLYTEFLRIADEQAALRRVATLIARGVEPSEVFDAVTDEMRRCLHAMTAGLWRFETTGEITLMAGAAEEPGQLAKWPAGTRTPVDGNNLASAVLRTGRAARMDAYEDTAGSIAARVREVGVRAAVGVPVIVDGSLWGLAAVGSTRPGPMPADTEARISDFAELVATALSNAATRAELQASRDELRVLAEQQAALRHVATLVARSVAPSEVFSAVALEMARWLHAGHAALYQYADDALVPLAISHDDGLQPLPKGLRLRLEGDNVAAMVQSTGGAARMERSEDAPVRHAGRIRGFVMDSAVGVPIVVDGHVWGVAMVGSLRGESLPPDTEARMRDFADLVATAIANAATRAELIASRARIVAAADEGRRQLERDLHDGTQQRLIGLGLQLRVAESSVPPELPVLRNQLGDIVSGLTGVSTDLREISRGIHPAILSKGGLGPALKVLTRRSAVPVILDLAIDRRLPDSVEVGAYYVVSEALTNVAKHSRAAQVAVRAHAEDHALRMSIQDDGIGGADFGRGSGLLGLRDRVEALGGKLRIQSPAGSGTSLDITIPLEDR